MHCFWIDALVCTFTLAAGLHSLTGHLKHCFLCTLPLLKRCAKSFQMDGMKLINRVISNVRCSRSVVFRLMAFFHTSCCKWNLFRSLCFLQAFHAFHFAPIFMPFLFLFAVKSVCIYYLYYMMLVWQCSLLKKKGKEFIFVTGLFHNSFLNWYCNISMQELLSEAFLFKNVITCNKW